MSYPAALPTLPRPQSTDLQGPDSAHPEKPYVDLDVAYTEAVEAVEALAAKLGVGASDAAAAAVGTVLTRTSSGTAYRSVPTSGGPSAYDVAVANGFVGTESDWLASLIGPQGPAGPLGAYEYTQLVAASVWVVTHNLDAYPAVSVVDSAGTSVVGGVVYNSRNVLTLTFSAPFAGVASLT